MQYEKNSHSLSSMKACSSNCICGTNKEWMLAQLPCSTLVLHNQLPDAGSQPSHTAIWPSRQNVSPHDILRGSVDPPSSHSYKHCDITSLKQQQYEPMAVEEQIQPQDMPHPRLVHPASSETNNSNGFAMMSLYPTAVGSGMISFPGSNPVENLPMGHGNFEHKGLFPSVSDPKASAVSGVALSSSTSIDLPTLSLGLSLSSDQRNTSSRHSSLHAVPCLNNGESIISVA